MKEEAELYSRWWHLDPKEREPSPPTAVSWSSFKGTFVGPYKKMFEMLCFHMFCLLKASEAHPRFRSRFKIAGL